MNDQQLTKWALITYAGYSSYCIYIKTVSKQRLCIPIWSQFTKNNDLNIGHLQVCEFASQPASKVGGMKSPIRYEDNNFFITIYFLLFS